MLRSTAPGGIARKWPLEPWPHDGRRLVAAPTIVLDCRRPERAETVRAKIERTKTVRAITVRAITVRAITVRGVRP